MTFQPGQSGNPGGRANEKLWRNAINRALARHAKGDLHAIDRCASRLVKKGLNGDLVALKEIGDRVDGKPAQIQILQGDEEGGPIKVTRVEIVAANADGKN